MFFANCRLDDAPKHMQNVKMVGEMFRREQMVSTFRTERKRERNADSVEMYVNNTTLSVSMISYVHMDIWPRIIIHCH